jgi:hypothetical protein
MRRLLLALAMLWPVSATADPSLSFDGTGDYARGTPPFTTMPLTMACFVRVTSLASNSTIMGTYNSGISRRRSMDLGTGGAVSATSGGAEGIVDATSSDGLTAGTWGTAAVIFGSTTSRLAYMDGGNEGTDTATSTSVTAADRLSMGRTDSASSSRPYTGQIAGCAVWSAALSAEEVAAFHKGISPRKIAPHALEWFAPYPGTGGIVQDWFGNNLTITDATASSQAPPRVGHP